MKVAPVSADMLIKIGLTVAVIGGIWYSYRQATGAVGSVIESITSAPGRLYDTVVENLPDVVAAVNPVSTENLIYKGANYVTGGSKDNSIGTRIYDFFHPVGNGALTPAQQQMVDEFNSRNSY